MDVFYQQAWGWQLRVADLMANGGDAIGGGAMLVAIPHSGFAVLQVCLSYFETLAHCQSSGGSAACFKAGVRAVFPSLASEDSEFVDGLLGLLYKGARCGLYHNSRTTAGVGLGQPPGEAAIAYDARNRVLIISPERLPRALLSHLEAFRATLLDKRNVSGRRAVEEWFDRYNE